MIHNDLAQLESHTFQDKRTISLMENHNASAGNYRERLKQSLQDIELVKRTAESISSWCRINADDGIEPFNPRGSKCHGRAITWWRPTKYGILRDILTWGWMTTNTYAPVMAFGKCFAHQGWCLWNSQTLLHQCLASETPGGMQLQWLCFSW